jgi:hypothetical protein
MPTFKVYQLLTAISSYPMIGLRHQGFHFCIIMGNAKLLDFPEDAFALVDNGNADRARAVFLLAYKHAAKIRKKSVHHPNHPKIYL